MFKAELSTFVPPGPKREVLERVWQAVPLMVSRCSMLSDQAERMQDYLRPSDEYPVTMQMIDALFRSLRDTSCIVQPEDEYRALNLC